MKKCSKCNNEKELIEFSKQKYGYKSYCKDCIKECSKQWYNNNKIKSNNKAILNRRKKIQWYLDLKSTLSCIKCGFSHPACIEFHHLNPKEKDFNISKLNNTLLTIEDIKKEIEKCIVLCSNCHKIEHFNINENKRNKILEMKNKGIPLDKIAIKMEYKNINSMITSHLNHNKIRQYI